MKRDYLIRFALLTVAFFSLLLQPGSGLARDGGKDENYMVGMTRQFYGDLKNAVHFFKLSAAQGYDMAQYSLGNIYYRGDKEVPQDYVEALKWYLMAAKQGNVPAQVAAGAMYAKGRGTKQDYVEANRWFLSAANKGNAFAQFNLGAAYENGLGVKADISQAFKWYYESAKGEVSTAKYKVGMMLAAGQGAEKDPVNAYIWMNRAAEDGLPAAVEARDEMARTMAPEHLAKAQSAIEAAAKSTAFGKSPDSQ